MTAHSASTLETTDCVIIGAGVIGLAIARALAQKGREIIILEAESAIGTGTSSRNSEVIHAGIYYPQGSLKARLCVQGRARLYDYCRTRHIPHQRCGKLIVATEARQNDALTAIEAKARANGVNSLEFWPAARAQALEPELACTAALHSPDTGIIDSHAFMLSLLGEAEDHGAMLALNSPVNSAIPGDNRLILQTGGPHPMRLRANLVINSAGLHAPALAAALGTPAAFVPQAYFAKGNYFTLAARPPFSRLIYPVPEPGGLGVHVTLDLAGQMRFGPDVEWINDIDYTVNPARAGNFTAAIRRYWPALPDNALHPGYAGIRPKLAPQGAPDSDFIIQSSSTHTIPGLINLYGIESPGLTAALAIGDLVAEMAGAVPKSGTVGVLNSSSL